MNSKAGSVPIWASEQTDFKLKPARPWFSFPRFLTRHLSALTWISNMGQDFPLSHSVYYNRTTSFGTCFKGRWISWCGTSVTDVILFRLWLITSNTHMEKAVGKGPSLTLTMSNNNLSFSVTPFFPVFLITKWSHLQLPVRRALRAHQAPLWCLHLAAPAQAPVHDASYLHGTAAQREVRCCWGKGHSGAAVRHTSVNTLSAAMTLLTTCKHPV